MGSVVSVDALVKRYGATTAVGGISFSIGPGEIFAILGPNGAGKTTTLECVEGVRRPDSGVIQVMGRDPLRESRRLRHDVGIQLQQQGLPSSMTVGEALTFFARYRGHEPRRDVAERCGLSQLARTQYGALSTGQQRRLSIALCVQHDPKLVILDEPTAGLDVQTRDSLHRIIRELRDRGATVVLASHDMAEVEKLADRVMVIVAGRVAASGSPREITSSGDSATRITVRTRNGSLDALPKLDGAAVLGKEGDYLRYATATTERTLKEILGWIEQHGDALVDLRVERPTLEERFLQIVGGNR